MTRLMPALLCLLAACGGSTEAYVQRFCAQEYECYPEDYDSEDECVDDYTDAVERYEELGEECEDALRDFMRCLSGLNTCDELDDYWEEPTEDYPCNEEEDGLDVCFDGSYSSSSY